MRISSAQALSPLFYPLFLSNFLFAAVFLPSALSADGSLGRSSSASSRIQVIIPQGARINSGPFLRVYSGRTHIELCLRRGVEQGGDFILISRRVLKDFSRPISDEVHVKGIFWRPCEFGQEFRFSANVSADQNLLVPNHT